jgi:hypothetical protein
MHPIAALMIADGREQEVRRALKQRAHLLGERPTERREPQAPRRFGIRLAHLFGLAGS